MAVRNIVFAKCDNCWECEPIVCGGGDIRVRVHKTGPYPVDVLVSIDGIEEYIKYDDFGLDETRSEVPLAGPMRGQFVKLVSRSELTLVKCLEM